MDCILIHCSYTQSYAASIPSVGSTQTLLRAVEETLVDWRSMKVDTRKKELRTSTDFKGKDFF